MHIARFVTLPWTTKNSIKNAIYFFLLTRCLESHAIPPMVYLFVYYLILISEYLYTIIEVTVIK
jgi:hypothetical protein